MSYRRRVVKRRPASLTHEEWVQALAAGKLPRPDFRPRDGLNVTPASFSSVLCCRCRAYHSPVEVELCMVLPRKAASAENSGSSTSKSLAAGLLEQYSELWAFLTQTSFPDGTKRLTGKISWSCESGLLGLLLNDLETGSYAFLNGHGITELLEEAELRLSDGSLSWRASRYPARGKGK